MAHCLLEWAENNGAEVHVHIGHDANGVRGLYASRDVSPGQPLLKLPSSVALPLPYTDSAYASPVLLKEVLRARVSSRRRRGKPSVQAAGGGPAAHAAAGGDPCGNVTVKSAAAAAAAKEGDGLSGGGAAASLHVSAIPAADQSSAVCPGDGITQRRHSTGPPCLEPFLDSLPRPHEVLTAYNFPEEMIPLLGCPELERVVRLLKRRAARVYNGTAPNLPMTLAEARQLALQCAGSPESAPEPTATSPPVTAASADLLGTAAAAGTGCQPGSQLLLADVEWAASVVCSRTFQTSAGDLMVMLPVMDMVNHRPAPLAACYPQTDSETETDSEAETDNESETDGAAALRGPGNASTSLASTTSQLGHSGSSSGGNSSGSGGNGNSSSSDAVEGSGGDASRLQLEFAGLSIGKQHGQCQHGASAASSSGAGSSSSASAHTSSGSGSGSGGAPAGASQSGRWRHAKYKRSQRLMSSRAIAAGEEVLFTYHTGMRNDELLVYYGFLDTHTQPPLLCAVDVPQYRSIAARRQQSRRRGAPRNGHPASTVDQQRGGQHQAPQVQSSSSCCNDKASHQQHSSCDHMSDHQAMSGSDDDLFDEDGELVIDPLDGPWRGEAAQFKGSGKQLQQELTRLASVLEDIDACNAEAESAEAALMAVAVTASSPRAAAAAAEAAQPPAGVGADPAPAPAPAPAVPTGQDHNEQQHLQHLMPWLPGMLRQFRSMRRQAVEAEMQRLSSLLDNAAKLRKRIEMARMG